MGLDVYLKQCNDLESARKREQEAETLSEKLWEEVGGYNSASEAEKDSIRDKTQEIYKSLNLDSYGQAQEIDCIEQNSTLYPEHLFKVGYLRSSYNSGGINSVLKRFNCPDLYDIFEPNEEYNFTPDWNGAQARAQEAIDTLNAFMKSDMANYDAIRVTDFPGGGVKEPQDALAVFKEQMDRKKGGTGFNSYSCREGEFWLDGITVVGVVPNTGWGGGSYIIVRNDKEESDLQWYKEALEVTKEMIDFVLAQPNPNTYYLAWSG